MRHRTSWWSRRRRAWGTGTPTRDVMRSSSIRYAPAVFGSRLKSESNDLGVGLRCAPGALTWAEAACHICGCCLPALATHRLHADPRTDRHPPSLVVPSLLDPVRPKQQVTQPSEGFVNNLQTRVENPSGGQSPVMRGTFLPSFDWVVRLRPTCASLVPTHDTLLEPG